MRNLYNIAIVGATGLVGQTFVKILEELDIPVLGLRLFASAKSVGKKIRYKDKIYEVESLNDASLDNIDYALFSAGKEISKKYVPLFQQKGITVIDNSSCFRMRKDVPLVIPEVNFGDIKTNDKIISNPNCSTIQCVLILHQISQIYSLKRVVYSTYQAVSGSGLKGIFDYQSALMGYPCELYSHDISKFCIPQIGEINGDGYTEEEQKMIDETRKILHQPLLEVEATCVRVPIIYGHGVSVYVETIDKVDINKIKTELKKAEGICFYDDVPLPSSIDDDKVHVGRLKYKKEYPNRFSFYCLSNNIRKGAALNAVQILKKLIVK